MLRMNVLRDIYPGVLITYEGFDNECRKPDNLDFGAECIIVFIVCLTKEQWNIEIARLFF